MQLIEKRIQHTFAQTKSRMEQKERENKELQTQLSGRIPRLT
jgi:hypothetical protein